VPVTGTPGTGALYPELSPGKSGFTKASYALIDHLRSIDKRRIRRVFGRVAKNELASVDQGLELFLGLTAEP
jgi:mRNA interferase MazF